MLFFKTRTYKHKEYDKAAVKAYILEHHYDVDTVATFEKIDYDLEKFFLTEATDSDETLLISLITEFKPNLSTYFIDLANGYWGLPNEPHTIGVAYFCKCFFLSCETDEDVWDLLYDYCPLRTAYQIYRCYTGECRIIDNDYSPPVALEDPVKARMMREYFYKKD